MPSTRREMQIPTESAGLELPYLLIRDRSRGRRVGNTIGQNRVLTGTDAPLWENPHAIPSGAILEAIGNRNSTCVATFGYEGATLVKETAEAVIVGAGIM